MNKYASGYTLIQILSVIGWFVIAISVIGGIFILSNAERGMGWVGISVAVAGSFQGLLLLGIGAIGTAILDGSVAQQEVAANISKKDSVVPSREREDLMPYLLAATLGVPGGEFIENFKGKFLIRSADGKIMVGNEIFSSLSLAKETIIQSEKEVKDREIKKSLGPENISFDDYGYLIFNGYKIPKIGSEFVMNGISYENPEDVAKEIIGDGSTNWALERYRIKSTSLLW